jgi:hypothetical protein
VREETEFGAPVIAARVIETRSRTSATRPTRQDD